MPELTPEKLTKLNDLFAQKGQGRLADNEQRLVDLFVTKEPDKAVAERNRALISQAANVQRQYIGAMQREMELGNPGGRARSALKEGRLPEFVQHQEMERQIEGTYRDPMQDAFGNPQSVGGKIGTGALLFGSGLPRAFGSLVQGVGKLTGVDTPATDEVMRDLAMAREGARQKLGMAGTLAQVGGDVAPLFLLPKGAFATPARAVATGGAVGFFTGEGGLKERGISAAISGASFGLSTKLTQVLRPAVGALQSRLLAAGMDANAATRAAVAFAPHVQQAITDAGAFTALGAVEQEARNNLYGTGTIPLSDLFLANLTTVLVAKGMGAAIPVPGAKFARGRAEVTLRRGMEGEPGGISANIARKEAVSAGHDPLLVHAAYMDALRGKGWTPEEARMLASGGPEALRRRIAPERVADLFAPDAPREPPVAAAPEIGMTPSATAKQRYEAQAQGARDVAAAVKARADAVIEAQRLRTMAANMEREAQRHTEVAAKGAVQTIIEGSRGEGPVIVDAMKALDPRVPLGDTANRIRKLQGDAKRLEDLASRIEGQATAEEAKPAQLALQLPDVARPLREKFNDPNVAKKMRLRASELRDEATRLREEGFAEEAKTTFPGIEPPKPKPDVDFVGAARTAKEWKAKADDARQRADSLEIAAETAVDRAIDRAKRANIEARNADPEADTIAGIVPSDSVGARKLADTTAADAVANVKRLADERTTVSPDQEIGLSDVGTPDGFKAIEADLARTPPNEPGAAFDRANAGDVGRVMPWDYFRQMVRTATKILGHKLGRELYEKAVVASWKTRAMKHLIRTAAAEKFRKWNAWMESLTPQQQAQAIDRFVSLTEQGKTTGNHPIETEFLTFWNRIMRGYANVIEGQSGKPLALKGRYISHIFETLDAMTPGAARRAAQQILHEWTGSATRAPGGSRFLHARQSTRQDFSRDLFFLFDAYVNSMTPALHWRPVQKWLADLRKPGGEFERIMAEKMAATGGDIKEAKKLRDRMDAAERFFTKHVAAGMGRQESWLGIADALDAGLAAMGRGIGLKPRAPYRTLMRAYTYAQYVGGLGLNFGSALRNLTQNVNTVAEVGPTWWGKAMVLLAEVGRGGKPEINRLLHAAHINDTSLARDVTTQVRSLFGRDVMQLGKGVADTSMALFQGAEWLNRSAAYLAGYLKAKSRGLNEKQARSYGREIVSRTQFDYAPGLGGLAYNGPFTHALFQFARFPVYQADYLASVLGRAVTGNTASMLPGDKAIAPAFRLALATMATSPLMAALGLDFNDSFGIGGVPEPVKFGATRVAEEVGSRFGGFEGRLAARRRMRGLGLEPYETTMGEASRRLLGPIYQQGESAWDWLWGDEQARHQAGKDLGRNLTVLFPGLAVHRLQRFMDEYDEKQVRNSRTGEVMFPIREGDAWARLIGLNTTNVIEGYENIRDRKLREQADAGMRAVLYDDVRQMYRDLKKAGDADYAEKSAAKFFAGLRDIYADTAIAPPEDPGESFRKNVVERIEIGERTTQEQRLKPVIDRSRILGPAGGR